MTHFTVLLKFEGDIADAETRIAEMLAPYDENVEVPRYKKYLKKADVQHALEHYKKLPRSPSGVAFDAELTPDEIKEYFGGEGGGKDRKGYFYWSTYNPKSKWDFYQIGGRWQGMLKLEAGAKGGAGHRSLLDNVPTGTPLGIDMAYLKDVDFEAMRKAGEEEVLRDWITSS